MVTRKEGRREHPGYQKISGTTRFSGPTGFCGPGRSAKVVEDIDLSLQSRRRVKKIIFKVTWRLQSGERERDFIVIGAILSRIHDEEMDFTNC